MLLVLAACLLVASVHAENNPSMVQLTTGDKSPVINAKGDATVNFGLDEEKLNTLLEQREDRLIKKLLAAGGNDKEHWKNS